MELLIIALVVFFIVFLKRFNKSFYKSDTDKGKEGEVKVARKLERCATKTSRLLNDVVLLDSKGESYQIDHIFINENGIWIIETKNWSGYIYGTDEQQEWTQVLAHGKEKNRMYSPVKQNLTHAYKIQTLLKTTTIPLVVFVSADIRNVRSSYVCDIIDLPRVVKRNFGFILSGQEIEMYYQKILAYQAKCNVTSEQHSKKMEEKQLRLKEGFCPKCGARLVERYGASGIFCGCSNYPRCNFTMKM